MHIEIRKAALLVILFFGVTTSCLQAQTKEQEQVDSLNALFNGLQQKDFTKAEQITQEALKLAIESKYSFGEANARTNLCAIYYRKGQYTKAIEQCFEAINLYEQEERFKNTSNYGLVFLRLASVLHTANDYNRSTAYSHQAITIAHKLRDNNLLALAYQELGNNYNALQQLDSALYYYEHAKRTHLNTKSYSNIADIENNIGIVYFYKEDYKEAIAHYAEALAFNKKNSKPFSCINNFYNIAEAYHILKAYNKSLLYADSAQAYAQQLKAFGNLIDVYLLKAKTYQAAGNLDSSVYYYTSTIALKDSIYNDTYKKELAALQTQSDIYKKETENQLLTKDKRIAELYRDLAVAGIVGLVILLGFILVNQRLRIQRRVKNQLEEEVALRTKEIFQQKETIFHTNLRLKLALNDAKLDSHFAIHVLNAIQQAQHNPKAAKEHLHQLTQLLQYILEKSPLKRVALQEEVAMTEHYIQLEQLRLNCRFDYTITVNVNEPTTLPALLLLPFVESAIQHGLAPTGEGGQLRLHLETAGDELRVTILGNGVDGWKEKHASNLPGNSIGQERLDLLTHLTHKNHLVTIENLITPEGKRAGTKIILQVPKAAPAILEDPEQHAMAASAGK